MASVDDPHTASSIFPVHPHNPRLLILGFWFVSPVRCFIFALIFFLVPLFLGLVNSLRIVLCWGVDGVEDLEKEGQNLVP